MKHNLNELKTLHLQYYEETTFGDYTIKIDPDHDVESPREWDNLGTMVCFPTRRGLGDKHEFKSKESFFHIISGLYEDEDTDYLTDEQSARCEEMAYKNNIILPLYVYEHSGITMNTTGFSCPWDSGQSGWIYVSKEQVRKEYDWKVVSPKRHAQIEKYLTGEVETYDLFLTGQVYGFSIERTDPDGEEEHIDSCWGFYGDETDDKGYMVSVIKDAIEYDIASIPQQESLL